jgi:hypothetical protein
MCVCVCVCLCVFAARFVFNRLRAERPPGLWAIATLNSAAIEKALSLPRIEQPPPLSTSIISPAASILSVATMLPGTATLEPNTGATSKISAADPRRRAAFPSTQLDASSVTPLLSIDSAVAAVTASTTSSAITIPSLPSNASELPDTDGDLLVYISLTLIHSANYSYFLY